MPAGRSRSRARIGGTNTLSPRRRLCRFLAGDIFATSAQFPLAAERIPMVADRRGGDQAAVDSLPGGVDGWTWFGRAEPQSSNRGVAWVSVVGRPAAPRRRRSPSAGE